jgi:glycosyltransferase involved in cell wall biosynthesis
MKILMVHNAYQQRGGEDAVVTAETQLIEAHGHTVVHYERRNDELKSGGPLSAISTGLGTVWASKSFRQVKALLAREKPDVAHFHNTFPLISPACYYACAEAGVPVTQTLHNYRLMCPGSTFLRDGEVCEECLGRALPWPSILHGCYRGSRPATLATAVMLSLHRAMGTWQNKVDLYIALTEFARKQFIEGGLCAERIVVKPNFVSHAAVRKSHPGDYALFVGRLSSEKGPQLLPLSWHGLQTQTPLRIVGDGPLLEPLREEIERRGQISHIDLVGRRTRDEVAAIMEGARFLIVPSIWFETFCLTVIEAYSCSLPVIASRIGALAEIVQDGVTGLHFDPGDAMDLAAKVEWAWTHTKEVGEMGRAARREYEEKYTAERNYESLMRIYETARARGVS